MSKLIEELKQEHQEIVNFLVKLQKSNFTSSNASQLLEQSKNLLLNHLEKEDKQLYPALRKKAETDSSLKKILDSFDAEMEKVTEFVLDFYQKYSDIKKINKVNFIKDMVKFIVILKNRINKEEFILYKEYEKLQFD